VKPGRELESFAGHTGDVNTVSISPDVRVLASGSDDKSEGLGRNKRAREI
jgi:WD40 repeat protein